MGQSKSHLMSKLEWTWELCASPQVEQDQIQNSTRRDDSDQMERKDESLLLEQKEDTKNNVKNYKDGIDGPHQVHRSLKIIQNDKLKKKKDNDRSIRNHEAGNCLQTQHGTKIEIFKPKSKIPAGTTIARAPPHENISNIIKQHGSNSSHTVRAYASSNGADNAHVYTPLPHSYWNVNASTFRLRSGQNYKKRKEKSPSGPALYDLYCFDIIDLPCTLNNVEERFEMPDVPGITDLDTGHPDVPPMLVVMCNLPNEEPTMIGNTTDGQCLVSVFYFVISEATLEALKDVENASPAVKLFVEWCKRAETDEAFRGRFKAMAVLDDIQKVGLPSFITGYNGKPVLINKSGKLKKHANYMEMSINVFMFNYIAKKSLHSLKPKFPTFILNIGFTIEGRSDEELPEVLLGGCRLLNLDPFKAFKGNSGIDKDSQGD